MPRALPNAREGASLCRREKTKKKTMTTRITRQNFETSLADFQSPRVDRFQILQSTSKKQIDDSTSHLISFYQVRQGCFDDGTYGHVEYHGVNYPRCRSLDEETEQSTTATSTTKKQYKSSLDLAVPVYRGKQEIHLARIIQQGVVLLHKVRTDAEGSEKSTGRQEGRIWRACPRRSPSSRH
jgi:hypothetical protein